MLLQHYRHQHSICRGVSRNPLEKKEKLCSIFPTKLPWQISNRVLHSCWMIIVACCQDQSSGGHLWQRGWMLWRNYHCLPVPLPFFSLLRLPCIHNTQPGRQLNTIIHLKQIMTHVQLKMINDLYLLSISEQEMRPNWPSHLHTYLVVLQVRFVKACCQIFSQLDETSSRNHCSRLRFDIESVKRLELLI